MIRLNKYIALSGVCSRRKADEYIQNRKVKVNGQVVTELGTVINESDIVTVNGKSIQIENKKIYLMLNKPKGYITTSIEQLDRPCVMDLIKVKERVYPIGRLDKDTEGLLLFTNDGDFANILTHPSKSIDKVYIVRVKGVITKEKITKLQNGVDIEGYITDKAKVEQKQKDTLQITIHEGKNRQVRKMCKAVDLDVIDLKRIKVANLELGSLKVGQYRLLKSSEVESITKKHK